MHYSGDFDSKYGKVEITEKLVNPQTTLKPFFMAIIAWFKMQTNGLNVFSLK